MPIYADRGPHGGIRLVDGYRTRLTGMTAEEAEALFLSGLPGPAAELGLGTVVTAARLEGARRLARPSSAPGRRDSSSGSTSTRPAGSRRASRSRTSRSLAEAVWEGRVVRVEYERGDATVVRVIGPLGLVLKGGVWYVVATVDEQIRTYRVSRVVGAVVLAERAVRPAGFELAAYWTESSAAYEREAPRMHVDVRLPRTRLDRLRSVVGYATVEAAETLEEPDPELDPAPARAQLARGGPGPHARDGLEHGGPRPDRGPRAGRGERAPDRRALRPGRAGDRPLATTGPDRAGDGRAGRRRRRDAIRDRVIDRAQLAPDLVQPSEVLATGGAAGSFGVGKSGKFQELVHGCGSSGSGDRADRVVVPVASPMYMPEPVNYLP